jgi:hypothetical protein
MCRSYWLSSCTNLLYGLINFSNCRTRIALWHFLTSQQQYFTINILNGRTHFALLTFLNFNSQIILRISQLQDMHIAHIALWTFLIAAFVLFYAISWFCYSGIQLAHVQRYWGSTVKMVFSFNIFTFHETNTYVALPNARRRSVRALS